MRTPRTYTSARSATVLTVVAALAFSLGGAPAATAATTVDESGTVTVTADPVTADPVVTDPVVTDPVVTDPVVTDPVATDPVVTDPTAPSKSCLAAPRAPWRIKAVRDAVDPTTFVVDWGSVGCATRYNVSIFSRSQDDVQWVDASTTSFTVTNSDPAATYGIQVSSRNDAGEGASTPVYYLRPIVPAGVSGVEINYSDLTTATLRWKAPTVRVPASYLLKVKRLRDGEWIIDREIDGGAESAVLEGLDARGIFVITLQPVNKIGVGPRARIVIGDERPNPVRSISVIRDPGQPNDVIISWLPSDNTLNGTVLGYEVAYGAHSASDRVIVKDTDATVTVTNEKSIIVRVRVLTDRGKSRWSKAVRIPRADAPITNTTNDKIDLLEKDGVVTVAAAQQLASNNRLVVRIKPTANNGGFADTQYSQNGAQVMTFRTVPEGSYVVTVDNGVKELARKYVNVGNVGMMSAPDWTVMRGSASIYDQVVALDNGGETRVFSTRQFDSQDMVLAADANLQSGKGYGVWFRATATGNAADVSGLTFQYDPGFGNRFLVRQWYGGKECSTPIASTQMPAGLSIYGSHKIVVAAQGDTLYATIDGERLFDLPSLSQAIAGNACGYPTPSGTMVGLRTWVGKARFANITIR